MLIKITEVNKNNYYHRLYYVVGNMLMSIYNFCIIFQHQEKNILPKCYFLRDFSKFDKFELWNGIYPFYQRM